MPITINGSGTITGLSAGGLPDGTIQPADLSTGAPTWDTSGNVGIGTSSPQVYSGFTTLDIASSTGGLVQVKNTGATIKGTFYVDGNGARVGTQTNQSLLFDINGTERARIDSSGNLLVNTTNATTGRISVMVPSSLKAIGFRRNSTTYGSDTEVGSITCDGSTTVYSTSSDYRLKENVQPMAGALATVAALKPCTYTWKDGGLAGQGFIAHELQAVVPNAVVGEKDAVDAEGNPIYQGIDTSFLVATLTAAIQELNAKVDVQAAEIAALKGAA